MCNSASRICYNFWLATQLVQVGRVDIAPTVRWSAQGYSPLVVTQSVQRPLFWAPDVYLSLPIGLCNPASVR